MAQPAELLGEFKLLIMGDGGVGIDQFVKSYSGNVELQPCQVTTLMLHTTRGPIKFNAWQPAEQQEVSIIHHLSTARSGWSSQEYCQSQIEFQNTHC